MLCVSCILNNVPELTGFYKSFGIPNAVSGIQNTLFGISNRYLEFQIQYSNSKYVVNILNMNLEFQIVTVYFTF